MNIGIASTDFERDFTSLPAKTLFEKVTSFGYTALQLSFSTMTECGYVSDNIFDIPPSVPDGLPETVRALSEQTGVKISSVNGTFNSAHPDSAVRREGVRRFELLADATVRAGSGIITLCSGTRCPDHMWTPHPDNETERAWEDMCCTMKQLTAIAERYGITLAIETEASNIINTPENVRRLLDYIASPRLKMIMDAANLFHAGQARPENVRAVMTHAFDLFGDDVVLAHGKDICSGGGIEFCATGEGIVDFPLMLRLLSAHAFSGDMIIHGVYDECKMARARGFMADIVCREAPLIG